MKQILKQLMLMLMSAIFYVGCSTGVGGKLEKQGTTSAYDRYYCSESADYEKGYNDGIGGKTMNMRFASDCREDLRDKSIMGYRSGFSEGRKIFDGKNYPPQTSTTQQSTPIQNSGTIVNSSPAININIGGNQNTDPTKNPVPIENKPNPKAYFCSVKAFMKTHEGWGPTQLEAKKQAADLCSTASHQMHCKNIQCQKNE
jgi:hypothetical protein